MDLFESFAIFVERPILALIPALALGALAIVSGRRLVWFAAAAWALYAGYEAGNRARILCSGECNIRADLLFIIPVLMIATIVGIGAFGLWLSKRSGAGAA